MIVKHLNVLAFLMLNSLLAFPENAAYEAEHSVHCGASWKVAFYKTGFLHEILDNNCGEDSQSYSKLHRLSAKQLQQLERLFVQIKFNELPKSIEPKDFIADEDVFIVKVHSSSGTKIVSAFGLERATNRDHARRFSEVWKAINAIIREPSYKLGRPISRCSRHLCGFQSSAGLRSLYMYIR